MWSQYAVLCNDLLRLIAPLKFTFMPGMGISRSKSLCLALPVVCHKSRYLNQLWSRTEQTNCVGNINKNSSIDKLDQALLLFLLFVNPRVASPDSFSHFLLSEWELMFDFSFWNCSLLCFFFTLGTVSRRLTLAALGSLLCRHNVQLSG